VLEVWEKKVQRALAGLPTDFDGDGFEEYLQWTDKDGVIHNASDCVANCHVSLACFTGICHPVE